MLLAALSVLAVSVIYEAPAAFADHDPVTEVWSATLTAGDLGVLGLGCDVSTISYCGPTRLLTDRDFTYGGATYDITHIRVTSNGHLVIETNPQIPDSAKSALTLHVGNAQFSLADATTQNTQLALLNTGLSWSVNRWSS